MLLSLADLITMATLLSVTPSIKDAFSAAARAEKRGSCFTFPCLVPYTWCNLMSCSF